jgi:hypothetical protein
MLESYSDKLMKDLDIYGDKAAKVKSFALQCLVIGFALGMTVMAYILVYLCG